MGLLVCAGAILQCSFGQSPMPLMVIPQSGVINIMPAANITDNKPIINIPSFIMCNSMANPTVAAATASALGVLTPMPCMHVILSPWSPGSNTVLIGGQPALNNSSQLQCMWGGCIQIKSAGQFQIMVS